MNRLLADTFVVDGPRERLWSLLDDPEAIQRILPGCEELVEEAPRRFRATLRTRIQFVTLRVQATATLCEFAPPDRVTLEITGRPLGLVGGFSVRVPTVVADAGHRTRVSYTVELQLTGRLAMFGAPMLRSTVKAQVAEMASNLEREMSSDPTDALLNPSFPSDDPIP